MIARDYVELIVRLEATPTRLRVATTSLGPRVDASPDSGAWSAGDIVRHVRASDAIIAPRVYHILIRERPPLAAFDERSWAGLVATAATPLRDQLDEFELRRRELVSVLRLLPQPDWSREGEHESRGTLSLWDVCSDLAAHEDEHCRQIESGV